MIRSLPSRFGLSPHLRHLPAARPVRLAEIWSLCRQRAALAALDPRLLDDIGVTRDEARHEVARPLWDMPGRGTR